MKILFTIIVTVFLCLFLGIILFKLLDGKIKKYTREELEEKQFGKKL
jgi:Na+/melibiose symporter-like transporter